MVTFFFLFFDPFGLPRPRFVGLKCSVLISGMNGNVAGVTVLGILDVAAVWDRIGEAGTKAGLTSGGCNEVTIRAVPALFNI